MAKAASLADLQELHSLIARSLNQRITQDMEDGLPTDAATLGAAIKFLKDNNVSADPADADDLSALRDKLKQQAEQRRAGRSNVVQLATQDLKVMEG
ncbi:DNA maturase A [Sphaerotilus phage vB_SnaP-R1]|uniref:DNA maturase A n=1 Tax=Sphaerotilus phage vB_SnaP-R1 TaxID=2696336 RepID=A0A6B9SXW4_9CAUD|nr:DNA maturase A [Sphaerotilus phage vB_SnaP-R1]